MAAHHRPTLITGATGLIGGATARALLGRGRPVRALVRDPARAGALAAQGVEVVPGDLRDPSSLERALTGVDAALLVSSLTPEQVELQGNFVDAAVRAGLAHVVKVSGFLTDPDSPVSSGRWHARTEAALRASAVGCTFLRAPFFMQNLLHSGPHALRAGELALPLNRARVAMVDACDLARVAAALLDRGPDGGTHLVTGPEALDFHEVGDRLSRHTGRCIRLRTTTPAETRIGLAEAGTPPWRIDLLMEFYEAFEQQRGETVTDVVETVTGIAAATLDAFLASDDARAVLAPADAGRK